MITIRRKIIVNVKMDAVRGQNTDDASVLRSMSDMLRHAADDAQLNNGKLPERWSKNEDEEDET